MILEDRARARALEGPRDRCRLSAAKHLDEVSQSIANSIAEGNGERRPMSVLGYRTRLGSRVRGLPRRAGGAQSHHAPDPRRGQAALRADRIDALANDSNVPAASESEHESDHEHDGSPEDRNRPFSMTLSDLGHDRSRSAIAACRPGKFHFAFGSAVVMLAGAIELRYAP